MYASQRGYVGVAESLLKHGADINVWEGNTALMQALIGYGETTLIEK